MSAVPREMKHQPMLEKKTPASKKAAKEAGQKAFANGHLTSSASDAYEKLLNSFPEFSGFGKLFKVNFLKVSLLLYQLNSVVFSRQAIETKRGLFLEESQKWYL